MPATFRSLALAALLTVAVADSGTGTTTRYWDCCKPSCAWNDLSTLGIESSVKSCDINDQPLSTSDDQSGCNGGSAYMCSDQSPWAVSDDLAYGFAAVSSSNAACCQCYELTFTSTAIAGKKMIVQATNTGGDVGATQFDLAMPGGGFGIFDGCTKEWNATNAIWGQQYGGSSSNTCGQFPCALQPGCGFRWGNFFQGADNPTVNWQTVACPTELTQKSGCTRTGDTPTPGAGGSAPAATAANGVCEVSTPTGSSPSASASTPAPLSSSASSSSTAAPAPASSSVDSSVPYSSMVSTFAPSSSAAAGASSTTSSAEPEETGDDECDSGLGDE